MKQKHVRLAFLILAILLNIGVLFYFKYYGFFIENINKLFGQSFTFENLVLPLGISFFTFQQLSYVIDSYSGTVPQYGFVDYALFVTFFPQLIAGPIVTHDEIVPQFADLSKKSLNYDNLARGMMAFAFGLAKKVLIADIFGNAVNWGFSNTMILDTTNTILVMLAYTIQIYFDFSGYCDMAIGIGLMFNIDIPMNFNSPYKALTITDFWKRWHITLTRFFTRYVYIPLGGSQKGIIRTYLNIFLVFLVSGLWHGANWTFVLWGVLHGVACILTRIFSKPIKKLHPAFNWLFTFGFVNVTWIYFRASSIGEANGIIKNLAELDFGAINQELVNCFNLFEFKSILDILHVDWLNGYPYLFMVLFYAFAFVAILTMKNTTERIKSFRPTVIMAILCVTLMAWSIISFSSVSTFLYFNF
ncbi:MAG: MBOAT family O-acyltransferase [Clostridia bacterium]